MAKPELGTKRTCPETGKKFYDLNRDPVVSPYTDASWPLSYFEKTPSSEEVSEDRNLEEKAVKKPHPEPETLESEDIVVPDGDDEDLDATYDDQDVDLGDDDDFLESSDDEETSSDMNDIVTISDDDQ
ncbi:TIGR02300 family protein [Candidatus Liberibacter sp.]|uniref:TIGR02300 family protein n=1 Tax=Candidatus Liberibacter sp. TaxID=34022 RepID=UPI0015F4BE17|nr:TIGR02300 family protein [Candidatus Liberibacter sp.]MBA5723767.1 TIGR02300 family protein [Candidatus Liberibacter sp.]